MKNRSLAIAYCFGRTTLHAFGVAFILLGLQLAVDGLQCCLQSERES